MAAFKRQPQTEQAIGRILYPAESGTAVINLWAGYFFPAKGGVCPCTQQGFSRFTPDIAIRTSRSKKRDPALTRIGVSVRTSIPLKAGRRVLPAAVLIPLNESGKRVFGPSSPAKKRERLPCLFSRLDYTKNYTFCKKTGQSKDKATPSLLKKRTIF